jgi:hypothetical protein
VYPDDTAPAVPPVGRPLASGAYPRAMRAYIAPLLLAALLAVVAVGAFTIGASTARAPERDYSSGGWVLYLPTMEYRCPQAAPGELMPRCATDP